MSRSAPSTFPDGPPAAPIDGFGVEEEVPAPRIGPEVLDEVGIEVVGVQDRVQAVLRDLLDLLVGVEALLLLLDALADGLHDGRHVHVVGLDLEAHLAEALQGARHRRPARGVDDQDDRQRPERHVRQERPVGEQHVGRAASLFLLMH